jgi:carbon monoxide dehydrogenase subunit G
MRNVSVTGTIQSPRTAVWAVLADYPNIDSWSGGVKKSYATGDATQGVGAMRHCDLAPAGAVEETIRDWEPESKMAISIDKASKSPLKHGLATFDMVDAGETTELTLSFDYEPRFGPLAAVIGPVLDKQFRKAFSGVIDDLEAAAQAQTTA